MLTSIPIKEWHQGQTSVIMYASGDNGYVIHVSDTVHPIVAEDLTHANYIFSSQINRKSK